MSVLGPDGRPVQGGNLLQEQPTSGGCLLCAVRRELFRSPAIADCDAVDCAAVLDAGVAEGLYAGLKILATILGGSGLEDDKAALLLGAAASLCERCASDCGAVELSGRARLAVDLAVRNIQAAGVFVVGRTPAGKVKVGP